MEDAIKVYNEGKLLVRAMDAPVIRKSGDTRYFEGQTWVDEFSFLMNDGLYSLSTTLIVPNVGVRTYKNVGFLINSDLAQCFHIAKEDSGSSGSIRRGDFHANKPDFETIEELSEYIKENNAITMNEVNVNVKLDGIVGLFINKCNISNILLKRVYVAKKIIEKLSGISYPIYLYDWMNGKLEEIELSKEQEEELISNLETDIIYCWPENDDEPFYIPIESSSYTK